MADLARAGTTVVLVEQYLSDALRLADLVYVLSRGELAFRRASRRAEPTDLTRFRCAGHVRPGGGSPPAVRRGSAPRAG